MRFQSKCLNYINILVLFGRFWSILFNDGPSNDFFSGKFTHDSENFSKTFIKLNKYN